MLPELLLAQRVALGVSVNATTSLHHLPSCGLFCFSRNSWKTRAAWLIIKDFSVLSNCCGLISRANLPMQGDLDTLKTIWACHACTHWFRRAYTEGLRFFAYTRLTALHSRTRVPGFLHRKSHIEM